MLASFSSWVVQTIHCLHLTD